MTDLIPYQGGGLLRRTPPLEALQEAHRQQLMRRHVELAEQQAVRIQCGIRMARAAATDIASLHHEITRHARQDPVLEDKLRTIEDMVVLGATEAIYNYMGRTGW